MKTCSRCKVRKRAEDFRRNQSYCRPCQTEYQRERRRSGPPCSILDCTTPIQARGLCEKHLARVYRHGDTNSLFRATCSIEDCPDPHESLGYCRKHYTRVKRHGDPRVTLRVRAYPPGAKCKACGKRRPYGRWLCKPCYVWAASQPRPKQLSLPLRPVLDLIHSRGLSVTEVARLAGVDSSRLYRAKGSLNLVDKVCIALDHHVDWLYKEVSA